MPTLLRKDTHTHTQAQQLSEQQGNKSLMGNLTLGVWLCKDFLLKTLQETLEAWHKPKPLSDSSFGKRTRRAIQGKEHNNFITSACGTCSHLTPPPRTRAEITINSCRISFCNAHRETVELPKPFTGVSAGLLRPYLCQHNSCLRYIERCGDCSCKSTWAN